MLMIGAAINAIGVILGSLLGLAFKKRIGSKLGEALMIAMGLVVVVIGVQSAMGSGNILCIVISMCIGTTIGELLHIDRFLDGLAGKVRNAFKGKKLAEGRFTDAMITCTILYCVGTMTILGSINAGLEKDYSMLFTKTVMDTISSVALTSVMGIGVVFSAVPVLIIEGSIALLAGVLSPLLGTEVIAGMNAVGGAIIIGMGINLTDVTDRKLNVANMMPAILIPMAYIPLENWIGTLL